MIRRAKSEADFALCVEIKNAVEPDEPVDVEQMARVRTGALYLHEGGGYAYVDRSSVTASAFAMVRVHPEGRRRGVGSALLAGASAHARSFGVDSMWGRVSEGDHESVAFVEQRGFVEVDREVSLMRVLGTDEAASPEGIVELREEHRHGAYAVAVECIPDMAFRHETAAKPYEEWADEELSGPVAFVALDRGDVVGYAALHDLPATPQRLEHGFTGVRKAYRERGIATALKRAQIAWAAAHGYRELLTSTQEQNAAMRAVNAKLGYVALPASIRVSGPLV